MLCAAAGVALGAHPSYLDRARFGREETDASPVEIRRHVGLQVVMLSDICRGMGLRLRFVKPHGALYNRAARDTVAADAIAKAVSEVDKTLTILALAGGELVRAASRFGLNVAREAFVDRAYTPQATLLSRNRPGSVYTDPATVVRQAVMIARDRLVYAIDGTPLSIAADSLCLHGDGPNAIVFAAAVREALAREGIELASFAA